MSLIPIWPILPERDERSLAGLLEMAALTPPRAHRHNNDTAKERIMLIGALGSFMNTVGSAALSAASAVAEDAAALVETHPTAALIGAGVLAYEAYNNNPAHLGNLIDTLI